MLSLVTQFLLRLLMVFALWSVSGYIGLHGLEAEVLLVMNETDILEKEVQEFIENSKNETNPHKLAKNICVIIQLGSTLFLAVGAVKLILDF